MSSACRPLVVALVSLAATTCLAQAVRVDATALAAHGGLYAAGAPRPAAAPATPVVVTPSAPAMAPLAFSALPFSPGCVQPYPNTNRAISTDSAGNIFVTAICDTDLQLTTSTNGGASWSAPVPVASGVGYATVEGGTLPGHAIIAWYDGASVLARTTTNFGTTFSAPVVIFTGRPMAPSQGLDAVAAGAAYHVMCVDNAVFPAQALTRRSPDRGASWLPEVDVPLQWVFGDLLHDKDTGSLEIVSDDPNVFRSTSTDGGATYSPYTSLPGGCCIYYSDWTMACGSLVYATGNSDFGTDLIWRWDFGAGPAFVEQYNSLPRCIPQSRSVDGDDAGSAFTVGTDELLGSVDMYRWRDGQPGPDGPYPVAPFGSDPHVHACGTDTAYITYRDETNQLQFSKFCLSGACCVPGTCAQPPSEPTCDAGGPYVRECAGETTVLQLDGTGSSDPGGLTLTYSWTTDCPGGAFDDPTSPAPRLIVDSTAPCPMTCSVTLTVSNGTESSTCSAPVTVDDTRSPSVIGGSIGSCYPTAAAAESAALAVTTATDACDPVVTKSASTTGTCSAQVRVTATDDCGNSAFVTYPTRIDGTPPVLTRGTIAPCYPTVAAAEAAAIAATTASDGCPGAVSLSATTAGTCSAVITVTGRDSCGNASSVTYSTRIDGAAPALTRGTIAACHPSVAAAEAAAIAATTAADDCPGTVALTASTTGTCSATITVTGTDGCGNASSVTYSTRIDGTPPSVTPGTIASCYATQAAAEAAAIAATTAVDDCPGPVTKTASTTGTCDAVIVVKATDECGNDFSVRYRTRIDGTAPVLTRGTIASCYASQAAAEAAAIAATTAVDDCPGTVALTAATSGSCSATITVTGTDACGNAASVTYSTRIDGAAPTLTRGLISACYPTAAAAEAAAIAATTATDNCTPVVGLVATTTGTCSATVTVTGTDSCGNAASITYSTRIDAQPPVLTPGTIAACYPTSADAESAALLATSGTENCPGGITRGATTIGTCNATVVVTWTDACGNAASVSYATRIDSQAPVVTAGTIGSCYPTRAAAEAAAIAATTATDDCPASLTYSATSTGTCAATVVVTVRDGCNNAASVTYSTRIDGTAPVLTAGAIGACYPTVAAAEAAALAATAAVDDCPGAVSLTAATAGTCSATVTVTGRDACGNASSVTYSTRIDGEAPVVTPSSGALACLWPPNHRMVAVSADDLAPVITDNCPGPISWTIVGCASSQPDNDLGDGNTEADCEVSPDGRTILARAERQGGDPRGRDYAVLVVATDSCGNTSAAATAGVIHVPHDSAPGERCPR